VRRRDPTTDKYKDVVVDRTSLLDPYVLNDPAVYHAVTSDVNRPVGVAQAYTWLKGVVDNLRMRKNLAELELVGKVHGKEVGGKGEPPDDLEFIDALIHTPQALEVEDRGGGGGGPGGGGGGGGELPKPNHLVPAAAIEAPKRRETMPIYLSRQRCEVCTTVIMRKLAGAPHLCAGMEYYFDSCNDALVSILHWCASASRAPGAPPPRARARRPAAWRESRCWRSTLWASARSEDTMRILTHAPELVVPSDRAQTQRPRRKSARRLRHRPTSAGRIGYTGQHSACSFVGAAHPAPPPPPPRPPLLSRAAGTRR